MRRLLSLAAFLLVISLVPLCAQRGGHASSGASHGSFSGGHAGFSGHSMGSPAFSGSHFGSGFGSHGFSGSHFSSRNFNRGPRINNFGFRNRRGFGYPFYAYGGIDPYWWWDSYSSNDEDLARDREVANEMNSQNLEEQQSLRTQDQNSYSRPRDPQPAASASIDPPTVLVFHDQHQREIQNYAIVGQMLWNFTSQRTEKIALAELDIPATIKANDERGVDFRLPRAASGQ